MYLDACIFPQLHTHTFLTRWVVPLITQLSNQRLSETLLIVHYHWLETRAEVLATSWHWKGLGSQQFTGTIYPDFCPLTRSQKKFLRNYFQYNQKGADAASKRSFLTKDRCSMIIVSQAKSPMFSTAFCPRSETVGAQLLKAALVFTQCT